MDMEIPGYEIIRAIGVGGMATAYLATQTSLARQVVLKVMDTTVDMNAKNVERFMNEAKIVGSLRHPNIVTIFDVGRHADLLYISMEYIEGGDLKARLAGGISPGEAIQIVSCISAALDCAHKSGVIHRDVKPANILFRKDGTPLLTDFGIAKKLTIDHDLTSTGIFLGSPNYMAPEQAEDAPIDGRADIYSLGIIFFEMLTGEKPYQADSVVDIILKHRQGALPRLPPELRTLEPLLYLMIAKKPKDRFRDAESLSHYIRDLDQRGVLRAFTGHGGEISGDVTGSTTRASTWSTARAHDGAKGSRLRTALIAGLVIAGAGFVALQYYADQLAAAPLRPIEGYLPRLDASAPVANPTASPGSLAPASDDVRKALVFLAQKSINDDRLISPPNDNAYFYYSKLRDIDPGSSLAEDGFKRIAERFAVLAEKEMAQQNLRAAHSYVSMGLQLDPGNVALRELRELTKPRPTSLLRSIWQSLQGDSKKTS
jgi:serine/threonine-protein kinase PpkA